MERFLYRLSISRFHESFLLKGALLFFARADAEERLFARPTRDIDLEALAMEPDLDALAGVFREVAAITPEDDGVVFESEAVTVEPIREGDRYGGIRVRIGTRLGEARDRVQIDVGFGDAITPGPVALTYPTLLDLPAPALDVYPIETVVAEKWEATVSLAEASTRLKDIMDIDELAETDSFDGAVLRRAIQRTFERRRTRLDPSATVLGEAYRNDPERQTLWAAARRRYERKRAPERFADAMERVLAFLGAPYLAAVEGREFTSSWDRTRRRWVE
jgi:hypothetical protein